MNKLDVERLARDVGEIAFANGKYTLQKGDVIMSPDGLQRFAALVLDEAANHMSEWPSAQEIRTIAEGLKP